MIPGSFTRKVRQKARAPRKPVGISAGVLLESRGSLADELGGADVALVPVLLFQLSLVKKHYSIFDQVIRSHETYQRVRELFAPRFESRRVSTRDGHRVDGGAEVILEAIDHSRGDGLRRCGHDEQRGLIR